MNEIHVAAVYARDGIRLLTAAASGREVTDCVAAYVRRHADHLLWPADSERVIGLLDSGEIDPAIELYFARVGERWEREYLRRGSVRSARTPEAVR